MPFAKDQRIRLLGVTSPKRSSFLPGVPAVAEDLPGYVFESWFGLLAPAGTPKALIDRINAEVAKLLKQPVILERLHAQGVEPRALSVPAFEKLVREDYEAMAKVVHLVRVATLAEPVYSPPAWPYHSDLSSLNHRESVVAA